MRITRFVELVNTLTSQTLGIGLFIPEMRANPGARAIKVESLRYADAWQLSILDELALLAFSGSIPRI